MGHKQQLVLKRLSILEDITREEAERLRLMGLSKDEAIWLIVLGSLVRTMQDLRNHQFSN